VSRPVYQSSTSATSAAVRLLTLANNGAPVLPVPHLPRVYRSKAGGVGLRIVPLEEGWGIDEIPAEMMADQIRWARIDALLDALAHARKRAEELIGSQYRQRYVDHARTLEAEAAALLDDEPAEQSRVA